MDFAIYVPRVNRVVHPIKPLAVQNVSQLFSSSKHYKNLLYVIVLMSDIAVAHQCSAAVSSTGKLFTWGRDPGSKILGHEQTPMRNVPVEVPVFSKPDCKALNVVFGAKHTLVLTQDHRVYTFGDDTKGQCGLGNMVAKNSPTLVDFGGNVKVG